MRLSQNEIRIGNLFYPIDRDKEIHVPIEIPMKISMIGLLTVSMIWPDQNPAQVEIHTQYRTCDVSPIPLTEEWLIKLKYVKYTHKSNELPDYKWFCDGGTCVISQVGSRLYYGGMLAGYKGLKYVHQLQNLYFVLTGKELNYESGE